VPVLPGELRYEAEAGIAALVCNAMGGCLTERLLHDLDLANLQQ
jgi:hypothetical protein